MSTNAAATVLNASQVLFALDDPEMRPVRGTSLSAGWDLRALEDVTVPSCGKMVAVDTGVHVRMPPGCYGRLAPRSGLAFNFDVSVGAGVIDGDYDRSIKVLLYVTGGRHHTVKRGDRIAQLIIERYCDCEAVVVSALPARDGPEHVGFGSTGV